MSNEENEEHHVEYEVEAIIERKIENDKVKKILIIYIKKII